MVGGSAFSTMPSPNARGWQNEKPRSGRLRGSECCVCLAANSPQNSRKHFPPQAENRPRLQIRPPALRDSREGAMAQSIDRCKVSNLHRIAVAIAFAPAVLPEIALATDHDHDSRPPRCCRRPGPASAWSGFPACNRGPCRAARLVSRRVTWFASHECWGGAVRVRLFRGTPPFSFWPNRGYSYR
jgi:hypothetical protein